LVLKGSTVNLTISTGPNPTSTEIWVPEIPTFMRLYVNGKSTKRWQICGIENSTMMDDCIELITKPDDDPMKM